MDAAIFVLSLLPGLAWLFFYLQEDRHPEPKRLILLVFFSGIVAALVAYFLQVNAKDFLVNHNIGQLSIVALVIFATIEEVAKFLAAWIVIRKSDDFDEPVDAMIYMVIAALGFATLENLGALFNTPSHIADFGAAFKTTSLRFVGATLLHTLTSGLVGYYWALDIRAFMTRRLLISGLIFASTLHAIFNYLIINYEELGYALLFVVLVGFFILSDFEKLRDKSV